MDWRILTTDGRISRTHFAIYVVVLWMASAVVEVASSLATSSEVGQAGLSLLLSLPIWWATFCVCVRRAHDMGQGAWFVVLSSLAQVLGIVIMAGGGVMAVLGYGGGMPLFLIGAALVIGSLVVMLMLAFAGPDDDNEWGPDPR